MKPDWKSYAELLGITAVVASLIFVGLELRQSQSIAEAEMHANNLANILEVHNAMINNAEIWKKGNADSELTPAEEEIYARLVTITNDRFYFAVAQQEVLGLDEFDDVDVAVFAGFLHENHRALQVWRSREERLAEYRRQLRPDEQVTPNWTRRVESAIAAFERNVETRR